jgi:hypothetical protein
MTSPYRGGPERHASSSGDDGIVDDLARQFADTLAFYRELIQNAIDAGATSIEVDVRIEAPGEVRVSVIDDGEGMDADIVENALLVLFRSTKEGKSGKIGKFGIGFISVFAVHPRLVTVETKREGHVGLALHLYDDHRYELFEERSLTARGTAVRLHLPMAREKADEFASASLAALRRWCRHAAVPIVFRSWLADGAKGAREERIDGPFELEALLQVARVTPDGSCRAIVGLPDDGKPRAAFFNHGLTLYETSEAMVGAIVFKVQSEALGHTLSRDDVRRDQAFHRALAFVAELANGPLVEAALEELRVAASEENHDRYGAVFDALVRSGCSIDASRISLLLAAPCGARAHGSWDSLGGPRTTTVDGPSEMVRAMGAAGIAVVDGRIAGGDPARRANLDAKLAEWLGKRFEPGLLTRASWIVPAECTPEDARLVADVMRALERHHRRPSSVVMAEVHGKAGDRACCGGGDGDAPWVLFDAADGDPFRLIRRRPLVLNAKHPAVIHARRVAGRAPLTAAQLLVRLVLLRYGALSERRCEALGDDLLEEIVTGGGS